MRVVAFNGSARKDGNTALLMNLALEELRTENIETEMVQLAGQRGLGDEEDRNRGLTEIVESRQYAVRRRNKSN